MSTEKVFETIVFPPARIGYPKLNPTNPPLQGLDKPRKRWSLDGYWNPDNKGIKRVQEQFKNAIDQFENIHGYEPDKSPQFKVVKEWANKKRTRKNDPSLIGCLHMTLGADAEQKDGGLWPPPSIVDADREPIPHTDIYPGCYARIIATLQEYQLKDKNGNIVAHGLSMRLKVVQFHKDGDRMGGDSTDYTQFLDEEFDDEDDAPAPKRTSTPRPGRRQEVSDDDI